MHYLQVIDILGTFSFAVAGSFAAMEKKLDIFGVLIIAFVTAIGGGTIRDMLIGALPVAWLTNMQTILVILIAVTASLLFRKWLQKITQLLIIFDAFGLGLFTLLGLQKAQAYHLHPGVCIALGTITGCFGGVLRDVLLNNVPLIFKKEIYASACIGGGLFYFVLLWINIPQNIANLISIMIVVMIRLLAVRFNWSLKAANE
jgi:uncharacterized membrane protein YeiH